ncbi:MAG: DNA polymerase III subunit delta' [Rhodocyclaceae bacterium]|nr:DNA polymerase III subunit delta' [Rhodocyclaceae bacterium]
MISYMDWHSNQWRALLGNGIGRLGHATLLIGGKGLGQREFADQLAALLLCEAPRAASASSAGRPHACGSCPSCHWLSTESHPDFRAVQPEDAGEGDDEAEEKATAVPGKGKKLSSAIKIGAIRALEDFVFVGSHRHGRRVVIIDPAEAMNVHAANALLKILEEPPASVYFILVSCKSRALLPTLRSRCRSLEFSRPSRADAEAWLRNVGSDTRGARFLDVVNGAPATVLEWQHSKLLPAMESVIDSLFALLRSSSADPLALATQWDALLKKEATLSLELLVEATQRWVFDLAQRHAVGEMHYHTAWAGSASGASAPLSGLTRGWRELLRFRRSANHPLNQLLFLEDFATQLVRAVAPADTPAPGKR